MGWLPVPVDSVLLATFPCWSLMPEELPAHQESRDSWKQEAKLLFFCHVSPAPCIDRASHQALAKEKCLKAPDPFSEWTERMNLEWRGTGSVTGMRMVLTAVGEQRRSRGHMAVREVFERELVR